MPRPVVSIVVPTYNERDNLPVLVERLFSTLERAGIAGELVVVDDNSPDGTADRARELSALYPIQVVVREGKNGLSSAVLAGWRVARGEILGAMDADLSHPPEAVPSLLTPILRRQADVSLGSRHVDGGMDEGLSPFRRLVSHGASLIARPLARVKDPMSGFFFFKRQVIEGVHLNPMGFKIALEVLVKGHYNLAVEVPFTFGKRLNGESKLEGTEYVNYLRHALRLYRHRYPAGRVARPIAASFSFTLANLAIMYLGVEVGHLGVFASAAIAFFAALAFLAGHIEPDPWGGDSRGFLGSFAIATVTGLALDLGVLALVVYRLALPYAMATLVADGTVVAPLLTTAVFRGLPGLPGPRATRPGLLQGR